MDPAEAMITSTEAMTNDSDAKVDNLNDLDGSSLDAEETLEEYFQVLPLQIQNVGYVVNI